MKSILTIFVSFIAFASTAQTFEEKVAAKSCDCVMKEKTVQDSAVIRCISRSMLLVAVEDSVNQYMEIISTVEGIQSTTRKVYIMLPKTCKGFKKKLKEKDPYREP